MTTVNKDAQLEIAEKAPQGKLKLGNVKKADLRNYVDGLVDARKQELTDATKQELKEYVTAVLGVYYGTYDVDGITRLAERLAHKAGGAVNTAMNMSHEFNNALRDLNSCLVYFENKLHTSTFTHLDQWMRCGAESSAYFKKFADTFGHDVAVEIQNKLKDYGERNTRILNLGRELNNIIDYETTGKRAYEGLVAVGLDMSKFESDTVTFLPAVTKLSEPICLLNKDCEE